ncbi:ABC transporter ATP-binding protein [Halalkalibacter sp. AB-rgal2]|uniref:ABC transporter ATP-binding protein n=1 Tax=Halalkalibacter sp. AB-rgal2 TaxID=3242695 RepID=UPI00359D5932
MNAIQTEHIQLNIGSFCLSDISLHIPKGKLTAIVGSNGSGKSTLLKTIAQLLKQESGNIYLEGQSIRGLHPKIFAQKLAMMPQSKQSLPNLTVKELIHFGRAPYKKWFDRINDEDQDIIEWAMRITNITKYAERMFYTLSGGEQQKVRIALALTQRTPVLLLDEPTTYLDIAHQLEVLNILEEINRHEKTTIIMVLHELQHAAAYCDYLLAMKQGKLIHSGEPDSLLSSQFLKEVYHIDAKVMYEDDYPLIIPLKKQPFNRRMHA